MSFFSWWYGRGWRLAATHLRPRLRSVAELFSVSQLLRTLFSPWRRIITYPGASLEDKVKAWLDNMVSRVIGFSVRLIVLFAALVTLVTVAALSAAELIAWPLLPLAVPGLLIAGLAV